MKNNLSTLHFLLIIGGFLLFTTPIFAQTFIMTDGETTNTCSGTFYDSGGAGGDYSNSETLVHTFCPDVPGECMLIDFVSFQVEEPGLLAQTDVLSVYDGNTTGATLLRELEGDLSSISFPVASSGGCITFEFTSNGNTVNTGWEATINCVPCPLPQDPTQQDCVGAIPVCEEFYFQPNSYNGFGTVAEINDAFTCLDDGEVNGVWYVFTAQQTGDLSFIITPVDPCDDYDWAIWDITGVSCSDIFPNNGLAPVISCNYSNSDDFDVAGGCGVSNSTGLIGCTSLIDGGQTGAIGAFPYNGSGNSQPNTGCPYNESIPVQQGNTYVLNVSNFSASQSGYYLDFRPSGGILFDTTPPEIVDITPPVNCWDITLQVQFSEPVLCSSIETSDFEVIQPNGTAMTIVDATSGLCNAGEYTPVIDLVLFPRITQSGTYTVNLPGNIEDNCGNIGTGSSFQFDVEFVDVDAGPDITLCEGEASTATIGGSPTSTDPMATYNWTSDPASAASFLTDTDVSNPGFVDASTMPPGTYTFFVETSVLGDPANPSSACTNQDTVIVVVGLCCASDMTPPEIIGIIPPVDCWDITLTVEFSEPVLCSSIDATDFDLVQPDGSPIIVASVNSPACNPGTLTNTINLILFPRITQTGTHIVTLVGDIEDNCGNIGTGSTFEFETDLVNVDAGPDFNFCAGIDPMATLGGSPTSSTPNVTYNWTSNPAIAAAFLNATDIANPTFAAPTTIQPGIYEYIVEASILGDPANPSSICSNLDTIIVTVDDCCAISLTTFVNNVDCNGDADGSITLVVSGGTAPFDFDWDNAPDVQNPTGLTAGTYTGTVTDALGCEEEISTTVNEPTAITVLQGDAVNPSCGNADGSITVISVAGGVAPYQYDFGSGFSASNSAGSLSSGVYNVMIMDASGCTITNPVSLTDNGGPMIDNTITIDALCGNADGSATVEVSAGNWPYTFNWENVANPGTSISTDSLVTGLPAGTYNVTVSSNFGGMLTPVYSEDFDGANTWTLNTSTGANGADNNFWQVNDTEGGVTPGSCGVGGNGDNTLHVTSVFNPAGGAAYDAGGLCGLLFCPETNMRSESPNISTIGFTAMTLSFDYIGNGDGLTDNASLLYSTDGGATFTILDPSLKSNVCPSGQGEWAQNNYVLPAACENINNLRLAFNWTNNDDGVGTDPSFAVNNIIISVVNGGTTCLATASMTINDIPGVMIDQIDALPATCNNATGETSVIISGGNMPYTFNWEDVTIPGTPFSVSNPATNLPAGTYAVTVTDADGCTDTASVLVNDEPGPALSNPMSTPSSCGAADGTATITATGGTAPYQYSWANVLTPGNIISTTNPATGLTPGDYTVTVTNADGTCPIAIALTVNDDISFCCSLDNIAVTDASCGAANGTATANTSGGTMPYTYNWENNANPGTSVSIMNPATGLSAGTYNVTVTDAGGCEVTGTTNINDIGGPSVTTSVTDATCGNNDGTATATALGGTPGYTYLWDDALGQTTATATGLSAGTYNVTVTDMNGCTAISAAIINDAGGPTLTTSATDATCGNNDGTATAAVLGGTPGYTYLWDDALGQTTATATGLSAGTYSVTVSDMNGCTAISAAIINDAGAPTVTTSVTDATCGNNDGTATATALGGTPSYTYLWDDALGQTTATATGLSAGTYNVTVTDMTGCTAISAAIINDAGAPTVTTSVTDATCGNNDGTATATALGGTPGYTYLWDDALGQATATATGLSAGTYNVTVSDMNGCTAISAAIINDAGAPTVTTSTTDATCGGSDGTATATALGGTPGYTYLWDDVLGQTTTTATGLSAGTYNVTVSDMNGCTAISAAIINDAGAPTLTTSATDATCGFDGTATVTALGGTPAYTYLWDDVLGQTTATATGLPAGTYNVTVTDGSACVAVESIIIGGIPAISIDPFSPVTDATCGQANGSMNLLLGGGTMPFSYNWENVANAGTTISTVNPVTNLSAGTYNVTVTDANNCIAIGTVTINDTGGPLLTNPTATDASCGGSDGTASVTVSGGTMPYTFNWENAATPGINVSTTNPATGLAAGAYNVTVTDASNCTAIETVNINDAGSPTVVSIVELPPADCSSVLGSATITLTGGTAPYTDGVSVFNDMITISGTQGSVGNFTFTDANACAVSGQFTIPTFNSDVSITTVDVTDIDCNNNVGVLTVNATGTNQPLSYSIDNGITYQTGNVFNNLAAGTYTVLVQDAAGCLTNAVNEAVQDNSATLSINVSGQSTSCANTLDGQATAAVSGGSTPYAYVWDNGEASATAVFLGAGNHIVTVTDAAGCIGTGSVAINAPAALTILSASSSPVTCAGGDDGTATIVPDGGTAPYTYQWNTANPFGQTATGLTAGVYNVQVTDANGCQLNAPVNITVIEPANPLVITSITGTDSACFGETTGSATVEPSGGTASYTYQWSNGANTQTAFDLSAGVYDVTVTDANGCAAIENVTISAPDEVIITIDAKDATCFGFTDGTIEITDVSGGAGGPYLYSLDGVNFILDTIFAGLTEGSYDVIVQDVNGCEATVSAYIAEPFELLVDLGADVDIALGGSTDLYAVTNFQPDTTQTWTWTPETNLAFGDLPYEVSASPQENTNYTVTVVNENGCMANDDILVRVDKNRDVFIPNIFSPNFDGDNDIFTIFSGMSVAQVRSLTIYDRWGEQIFEATNFPSNDSTYGWDGSHRGKQVNPGVFVYYVEVEFLDGAVIPYKGDVTIVK